MLNSKKMTCGDFIIYLVLGAITFITLYPLLNVLAISLAPASQALANPFMILPMSLDFSSYRWVLSHPLIWQTYGNTICITLAGVSLAMVLTCTYAYALSSPELRGKGFFTSILLFTMFFNGGLIPNFYLMQSLGIYDTLWALIFPGVLSAYNTILVVNFFRSISENIKEAARIDGASEFQVFIRIVLPLSKPILATIALFQAVGKWNSFFDAIVYIRDQNKWTLQLLLREILFSAQNMLEDVTTSLPVTSMRYAVIIVAVVPILCIYPFIQKHFAKGVMLGGVKG